MTHLVYLITSQKEKLNHLVFMMNQVLLQQIHLIILQGMTVVNTCSYVIV